MQGSMARLQATAGNGAVAGLLASLEDGVAGGWRPRDTACRSHAPPRRRGGAARSEPGATPLGTDEAMPLDEGGQAPAPPVPTTSFTKVGPPTKSGYTVSGTLRQAAEAEGARKEAGATYATPDLVSADDGTRMTQA